MTGSRPVSFLPDSSSAFDKHREEEGRVAGAALYFATFTRLFTNGLVTRSAPALLSTLSDAESAKGRKKSPSGIPRGESERAIESSAATRENLAAFRRPFVLVSFFRLSSRSPVRRHCPSIFRGFRKGFGVFRNSRETRRVRANDRQRVRFGLSKLSSFIH